MANQTLEEIVSSEPIPHNIRISDYVDYIKNKYNIINLITVACVKDAVVKAYPNIKIIRKTKGKYFIDEEAGNDYQIIIK